MIKRLLQAFLMALPAMVVMGGVVWATLVDTRLQGLLRWVFYVFAMGLAGLAGIFLLGVVFLSLRAASSLLFKVRVTVDKT